NHPNYVIGCSDEDIRQLASSGVFMEFTVLQFVEGREKGQAHRYSMAELKHYIELGGVERTIISSDLGMTGAPLLIDGWRRLLQRLLDSGWESADIRTLTSINAARMLNLD